MPIFEPEANLPLDVILTKCDTSNNDSGSGQTDPGPCCLVDTPTIYPSAGGDLGGVWEFPVSDTDNCTFLITDAAGNPVDLGPFISVGDTAIAFDINSAIEAGTISETDTLNLEFLNTCEDSAVSTTLLCRTMRFNTQTAPATYEALGGGTMGSMLPGDTVTFDSGVCLIRYTLNAINGVDAGFRWNSTEGRFELLNANGDDFDFITAPASADLTMQFLNPDGSAKSLAGVCLLFCDLDSIADQNLQDYVVVPPTSTVVDLDPLLTFESGGRVIQPPMGADWTDNVNSDGAACARVQLDVPSAGVPITLGLEGTSGAANWRWYILDVTWSCIDCPNTDPVIPE